MNKHQNYATFNNNPYITASHQATLIVHVSVSGLGSDVGIIIEGSSRILINTIIVETSCLSHYLLRFNLYYWFLEIRKRFFLYCILNIERVHQ